MTVPSALTDPKEAPLIWGGVAFGNALWRRERSPVWFWSTNRTKTSLTPLKSFVTKSGADESNATAREPSGAIDKFAVSKLPAEAAPLVLTLANSIRPDWR